MRLNGAQIDELAALIGDAFNHAELERLVHAALNERLYDRFASPEMTGRELFYRLVIGLENHGLTARFLEALRNERHGRSDVVAACDRLLAVVTSPDRETRPEPPGPSGFRGQDPDSEEIEADQLKEESRCQKLRDLLSFLYDARVGGRKDRIVVQILGYLLLIIVLIYLIAVLVDVNTLQVPQLLGLEKVNPAVMKIGIFGAGVLLCVGLLFVLPRLNQWWKRATEAYEQKILNEIKKEFPEYYELHKDNLKDTIILSNLHTHMVKKCQQLAYRP
jgi:hypothetical protein